MLQEKKKRRSLPAGLDQKAVILVPRHSTGKTENKILDEGKSYYIGLVIE